MLIFGFIGWDHRCRPEMSDDWLLTGFSFRVSRRRVSSINHRLESACLLSAARISNLILFKWQLGSKGCSIPYLEIKLIMVSKSWANMARDAADLGIFNFQTLFWLWHLTNWQSDKRVTGAVKILWRGSIEPEVFAGSNPHRTTEAGSKSNSKAPPEIRDIRKRAVKLSKSIV